MADYPQDTTKALSYLCEDASKAMQGDTVCKYE